MKKFAFILMGSEYNPEQHKAEIVKEKGTDYIFTVQNFDTAKELVLKLVSDGFGAIEICGAFGREKALELIELTENKIPISYVIHEPEQDHLITNFFGA